MRSLLPSLLFCAVAAPAWAGPGLVTTAQGDVKIVGEGAPEGSPAAPFLVQEGQRLALGEGAEAVVLVDGQAAQVKGPREISLADLAPTEPSSGAAAGALLELVQRDATTAKAAASRGDGELTLLRPPPGSRILGLHTIRWACDACGELDVAVYDFLADEQEWTAKGSAEVAYAGPELTPGVYSIVLDGRDFAFTVVSPEEREKIALARQAADAAVAQMRASGVEDPAALASVPAAVYLRAGLSDEALQLVEAARAEHPEHAGLERLLGELRKQVDPQR